MVGVVLSPRSSGDRAPPSGGGSVGSNPTGGAAGPPCLLPPSPPGAWPWLRLAQMVLVRSRRALVITLTDESAIAAAAIIGDKSKPKTG
jgi:hypothetical protein